MRWIVTAEFRRLVERELPNLRRVAVVGGSSDDPEIQWLKSAKPDVEIQYFGIASFDEADFTYLDLNAAAPDGPSDFDLVHCAQVVEHVWNLQRAILNVVALSKPGGLVWLNCPASCHAHGSPEYFSAGYQPELLVELGRTIGCSVVHSTRIGSRRAYFYEHQLRRWPDRLEYEHPMLRMTAGRGGRIRAALRWLKYLPGRSVAQFMSATPTDDVGYATQTVVLLRAS